jgi:acylphosphatase
MITGTKHIKLTISGRVQGVGFRFAAMQMAYQLNVKGIVKNLPNGKVYIEVESDDHEALNKYADWCETGPPGTKVEHVDMQEGEVVGYLDFSIKHNHPQ